MAAMAARIAGVRTAGSVDDLVSSVISSELDCAALRYTSSRAGFCDPYRRVDPTTPTMVIHDGDDPNLGWPNMNRWPTGLRSAKNWDARAALMSPTRGAVLLSASVKSRPPISVRPSVCTYPGNTLCTSGCGQLPALGSGMFSTVMSDRP